MSDVAIDVWSAGIILLFFLIKKFPLFQSGDDVEALVEIASIIGKRRMEKIATLHSLPRLFLLSQADYLTLVIHLMLPGRTFATNIPSITPDGITWREFIERQNPSLKVPCRPDPRFYPHNSPSSQRHAHSSHPPPPSSSSSYCTSPTSSQHTPSSPPPPAESYADDIEMALDLVEKVMNPDSTKRITPRQALYHPFLHNPDEADDDFFPHPFGEGVCGKYHFVDEVTEEYCVHVTVKGKDGTSETKVKRAVAGEGIAMGRHPCEFHKDDVRFSGSL